MPKFKNLTLKTTAFLLKDNALTSVITGLLVGIPFIYPILWPLVFAGFPLHIIHIRKSSSSKRAFFYGWVFGSVFIATYSIPLFDAYPLPEFWNVSQQRGLTYITLVWGITSLVLGVLPALWSLIIRNIQNGIAFLLAAPVLWVIGEYIRALLLSLYLVGENTTLGVDFSFGFIGYTIAGTPLLWFAKFGGVYMLSFVVIALSVYISLILRKDSLVRSKKALVMTAIALYVSIVFVFPHPVSMTMNIDEPILINNVSIFPVSTTSTLGQETIDGKILRTESISTEILNVISYTRDPIVFILPENSDFINRLNMLSSNKQSLFQNTLKSRDVVIIDSGPEISDGETLYKNTIRFWTPEEGIVSIGKKEGIVPFGEYMPLIYKKLFSILGSSEEDFITSRRPHISEKDSVAKHTFNNVRISALSCSEIYNPTSYKRLSDGTDVLVNVASYAIFNASTKEKLLIWPEIVAMAKTHAIWSGKPYIQASNDSPSFVVIPTF